MPETFFIQTSYYDVDDNMDSPGFLVFPNPTKGSLTLRFGAMEGPAEVLVYNVLWQKVDALSFDMKEGKEIT